MEGTCTLEFRLIRDVLAEVLKAVGGGGNILHMTVQETDEPGWREVDVETYESWVCWVYWLRFD